MGYTMRNPSCEKIYTYVDPETGERILRLNDEFGSDLHIWVSDITRVDTSCFDAANPGCVIYSKSSHLRNAKQSGADVAHALECYNHKFIRGW